MKTTSQNPNNPEEETKDKSSSTPDSFERRNAVIESIKETFKGFNRNNCKGKPYRLWIEADAITFGDLTSKDSDGLTLEQELSVCLSKIGYEIGSLKVRNGSKPEGNPTTCKTTKNLVVEMWLEEEKIIDGGKEDKIKDKNCKDIHKARITLAPGSPGSLKKPEGYVIESAHAPYNIGRVIEPGDNLSRTNHIEVIDETFRVSRTHAHIGYSPQYGFYIQCEYKPSGINEAKRIRPNDAVPETPLKSPNDMLKLQDGDLIELSGLVRLLFQRID